MATEYVLEQFLNEYELKQLEVLKDDDYLNYTFKVNDYVKKLQLDVQRGDIISLSEGRYRNDGVLIFDGEVCIALDQVPDEYGNIPSTFPVINEFPINYWERIIRHNCLVPFNHKRFLKQIIDNLKLINNKELFQSFIKHKGKTHYLFFVASNREQIEYKLWDQSTYYWSYSIWRLDLESINEGIFAPWTEDKAGNYIIISFL